MQKLFWLSFLIFYVTPLIYNVLLDVREGEKPAIHCCVPVLNAYLMGFTIYHSINDNLTLYIRYGIYRVCRVMMGYYLRKQNLGKLRKWAKISVRNNKRLDELGDRQRERLR